MGQTRYHLHLKGYVGGYDFDSNYVDYILDKHSGEPVNVLIDSLGGSLSTALSIASAFRQHGDVSVHFVGMNASAATIASLGARRITMDRHAMYLVHKCSAEFFQWGSLNADELARVVAGCEQAIRDLEKMDENVAAMYAGKCSKQRTELLELMRVGGWLTASEAREWGFVDEVTDEDEPVPELTEAVATALAAEGIPIPDVPFRAKESHLARFVNALAGLFRAKEESQPHNDNDNDTCNQQTITPTESMTKKFEHIGAVLEQDGFDSEAGRVTLSEEQMQRLDERLGRGPGRHRWRCSAPSPSSSRSSPPCARHPPSRPPASSTTAQTPGPPQTR